MDLQVVMLSNSLVGIALQMEATRFSEIFVTTVITTRRNNPERYNTEL
jgi:hypothetical protein